MMKNLFLKSMMSPCLKATVLTTATGLLAISAHGGDKVQLEGARPGFWTMDYDAARKVAAEKKLPLLLNFTGSDWCGWCQHMDETVFAKDQWKKFAEQNAILVTIDNPRDESIVPEKYRERNTELGEQFGVEGYPTYIIVDSDGETVLGKLGAGEDKTPDSFIEEFKEATRLSASNIEAYTREHPDKATAYKAAIAEYRAAERKMLDWLATEPERNDENIKIFQDLLKPIKAAREALEKF